MQTRTPEGYITREQAEALLAEAREAALSRSGVRGRARPRKRTGAGRVLHALSNALYAVVIALLLIGLYVGVQAKLNDQPASLLGYSLYQVKTGSMVPTLPIGSFIVTREPDDPAALPRERSSPLDHRRRHHHPPHCRGWWRYEGVATAPRVDNPLNAPDLELETPGPRAGHAPVFGQPAARLGGGGGMRRMLSDPRNASGIGRDAGRHLDGMLSDPRGGRTRVLRGASLTVMRGEAGASPATSPLSWNC